MKAASYLASLTISASLLFPVMAFSKDDGVQIPVPPPVAAPSDKGTKTLENLDKAKAAFTAGHYQEALSELAQAQKDIRLKHASEYRPLLPAAPSGWNADENAGNTVQNMPALGGLTIVTRKYSANGHTVEVSFVVDASPIVVAGMMIPPSASANDTSQISYADVKGGRALYKEGTNSKTGVPLHSLTLAVGSVAVMVSSSTLGKDTLEQFASIIDYDALRKIH